jgi:N-acetylmuramoyl-L-alanine amidase
MSEKIIIDAGHGGYDNGASYGDRKEKDEVLKLAFAVGNILESDGYDVVYTRTDDTYTSPTGKARIGNESGADFFISIHRNSASSPNLYNGVQTLVYDNNGIKVDMAENINAELEKVGYKNIGIEVRPNLAVLRRTSMPAVLVEVGFINSDIDNKLLDTKFNETAYAIAKGIEETLAETAAGSDDIFHNDMPEYMQNYGSGAKSENRYSKVYGTAADNDTSTAAVVMYQLLVGCYRDLDNADNTVQVLKEYGYDAKIYFDEDIYQLRIGEYETREDASEALEELRENGIDAIVVAEKY